jgi:hypothetical protein
MYLEVARTRNKASVHFGQDRANESGIGRRWQSTIRLLIRLCYLGLKEKGGQATGPSR